MIHFECTFTGSHALDFGKIFMRQPERLEKQFSIFCAEDVLRFNNSDTLSVAQDCISMANRKLNGELISNRKMKRTASTAYMIASRFSRFTRFTQDNNNKLFEALTSAAASCWYPCKFFYSSAVHAARCYAWGNYPWVEYSASKFDEKILEYKEFARSLRTITNYNKISYMAKQLGDPSAIGPFLDEIQDDVDLITQKDNKFYFNVPGIDVSASTVSELVDKIGKNKMAMTWLRIKFNDAAL